MSATGSSSASLVRSTVSIVTGYLFLIVCLALTYLVGAVLFPNAMPNPGANVAPTTQVLIFVSTLCICYGFIGSRITAALAKRARVRHSLALAGVALIIGLLKPVLAPHQEPLWSHLVLLLACITGIVIGAFLPPSRARIGDAAEKASASLSS